MWSTTGAASVNATTGAVSNMVAGNCYTFTYTVTNGECSDSDEVEVCVDEQPTAEAGDDQALCNQTTAQLNGSQDVGSGMWSTTGAASVNATTGAVSNMVAGNCYTFTYTVTNGECSDSDEVEVCIDEQPTAEAGDDQALCNQTTASLSGSQDVGSGMWSTTGAASVNATTGAVSGLVAGNCYTFTYTVTNGECSDSDEVEVCIDEQPTAEAGDDQALCNQTTASLSGSQDVGSGMWSTTGAASVNATTGAVSGLVAGNCYTFTYTVTNGECSDNDEVEVCVDDQPNVNAGADQTLCNQTTTSLNANQTGGSWNTSSGASVNASTGVVSGLVAGNCYTFTYTLINGECSDSDDVEVCVDAQPTAEAGDDQALCNQTTAQLSGSQDVGTGTWSTSSGASVNATTGAVSNMVAGNCYTFTYTVINGECSDSDEVEVCVDEQPTAEAGDDQALCNQTTAQLNGSQDVGSGLWSTSSGANVNSSTGAVSNMVAGNCYTFIYTVTNGECSDSDNVELCVDDQPIAEAGTDQALCNQTTAQLSGSQNVGSGLWSTSSGANVNATTGAVSNIVAGNCYTFTYTVTNGECSDSDDVEVCIDAQPTADAGPDQNLCNVTETQLSGSEDIGTGAWSTISGVSVNASTGAVSGLEAGNCYTFTYTVTNGECSDSDEVEVCIDEQPGMVSAGEDQILCNQTTTTLTGTTDVGIGSWSTSSAASVDATTGAVSGMVAGNCYIFTFSVQNDQCMAMDEVEVCIDVQPNVNAGADQVLCNQTTTSLTGSTDIGTGTWSTPGPALVDLNTGAVVNMEAGNCYTFTYTVINGECSDSDEVEVCVDEQPTANAGDDQAICNQTTAQLSGSQDVGNGMWSTSSGASVNATTGAVSNMVSGNCYTFTYTVTNGECSDSDEVEVCVDEQPTADAGDDQALCDQTTAQLSGSQDIGSGMWSTSSGANVNATTGAVSGMVPANCYTFTYTVTNGECTDNDEVEICIDEQPGMVSAGDDQALCNQTTTSLTGTTDVGTGTWSTTSAASVDAITGAVSDMVPGNCYTFTFAVQNAECMAMDGVEVCVDAQPIANAGDDQALCNQTTAQLSGSQDIGEGSWSTNSSASVDATTGAVSDMVPGSCYVFVYTVTNGECSDTDEVELCVSTQPSPDAGSDQTLCDQTSAQLSGNTDVGMGTWSTTSSAIVDPATGAVSNMLAGNCYTFTYTVASGVCGGSDEVEVCVDEQAVPDAGPDQILCDATTATLLGSSNIGSGEWSTTSGAIVDATTGAVSNMVAGNCYTFTYTVVNGECTTSDDVEICVNEAAIAEASGSAPIVCETDIIDLSAQTNGTGSWAVINGSGNFTPSNTDPMADYVTAAGEIDTLLQFIWTTDDPDGAGPCPVVSDTVEVFVNEAPMVNVSAIGDTVCAPDPDSLSIFPGIDLEAALSGSATSGTWSGGLGTINFPNSPNQATYIPDPSEINTTVTLYWTTDDPDGLGPCESVVDSVDIYIQDAEIVGEILVTNSSACGLVGDDCNGSITFTLLSGPVPGFYEVRFISGSIDTTAMVSGMAGPPASVSLTELCTGGYFIISVTPPNGCTDIINRFVTIEDPNAPEAPLPTATTPVCVGADIELFANINLPAGSYFWEGPNGFVSFEQNPVIPNASIDNIGIYTLAVTSNGCESAPGIVEVELFSPPPAFSTELAVCEDTPGGGIGTFDLSEADEDVQGVMNSNTPVTYYLTENDAINNQNPLISPYTSIATTVYASITNEDGCSTTAEVNLIVNPFSGVEPIEIDQVCAGNHLYVIDPNNPPEPLPNDDNYVYNWYLDGVLVATITGIPYYDPIEVGVYTVEVFNTNSDACTTFSSAAFPYEVGEIIGCSSCGNTQSRIVPLNSNTEDDSGGNGGGVGESEGIPNNNSDN